jgi:hypothetical protein
LIDAVEEALNKSVVPKLQELIEAAQQIEQKIITGASAAAK